MEEFTLIQIRIPKDFNLRLNKYIAELRYQYPKDRITKEKEIIRLAQIGLLNETINQ
jgi:hypothetical protein